MVAPTYEAITDELGYGHCYFVQGNKGPGVRLVEVSSPPVTGWSHVIIRDGEKHCTLFCPFTFTTMTVSHRSMEYASLRAPASPFREESLISQLQTKWLSLQQLKITGDFGMASHILQAFNVEPPPLDFIEVDDFGDPVEITGKRKGKHIEEELKKPVKRNSKRGKVLAWFLGEGGGPKSIKVCMDVFKISRSNALSYLFMLNKDHGIGYVLGGSTAAVTIPGGVDPFTD